MPHFAKICLQPSVIFTFIVGVCHTPNIDDHKLEQMYEKVSEFLKNESYVCFTHRKNKSQEKSAF